MKKKLSGTSAVILAALARAGKTRSDLAEVFGVSRSTMWVRINNGKFSYDELQKIADFTDSELVLRMDPKKQ